MNATVAAIIPTRNRPELAIQAIGSLLAQDQPVEIFVSDNSPSPEPALRTFCDGAVTYLRPGESLGQARHWDWAIGEAMKRSSATHFTVHYDRKVSKPDFLGRVGPIVRSRPDMLICWPVDYVADVPPPMRLWQPPWTGKLYALRTGRIVELVAAGRAGAIHSHALPLLSNCLVPRAVLAEAVDRFGTLCDSTTPDSCFAFRFAALRDRYLYLDRPLGVLHAPHRSAGSGYAGGGGGDWEDFQKQWGDAEWLAAAPIPGLNLGLNMLYHEYELVRRTVGDGFPPIRFAAYLDDLARGLDLMPDRQSKAALRRVLEAKGWQGGERSRSLGSLVRRRLLDPLETRLGLRRPNASGRIFRRDEDALRHALTHPRRPQEASDHLDLLEPVRVDAG
ncbi:MAG TPA: hypothetical protein VIT45_00245 [Allosphingosinicella sp.]